MLCLVEVATPFFVSSNVRSADCLNGVHDGRGNDPKIAIDSEIFV